MIEIFLPNSILPAAKRIAVGTMLSAMLLLPVFAAAQSSQPEGALSLKPPSAPGAAAPESKPREVYRPRDICPAPSAFEQEVLDLINAERAAEGLSPVAMDKHLADAALVLAQDMHDNCFLSHTGSDGSRFNERILDAGYPSGSAMGEIAAAGYTSPQAVVTGWMNSSGHRANILNGSFTHAGVSYVGSSGTCRLTSHDMTVARQFWNVDFGGSSDAPYTGCSGGTTTPSPPQNLGTGS